MQQFRAPGEIPPKHPLDYKIRERNRAKYGESWALMLYTLLVLCAAGIVLSLVLSAQNPIPYDSWDS